MTSLRGGKLNKGMDRWTEDKDNHLDAKMHKWLDG